MLESLKPQGVAVQLLLTIAPGVVGGFEKSLPGNRSPIKILKLRMPIKAELKNVQTH
jgi:hypothetical protein